MRKQALSSKKRRAQLYRSRKHSVRSLESRREQRRRIAASRRFRPKVPRPGNREVRLVVPRELSFVDRTEDLINFLARAKLLMIGGNNLFIDFSDVETMSLDGIAMLLAHISNEKFTSGRMIRGNHPRRAEIAQQLRESGFYDHVQPRRKFAPNKIARIVAKQDHRVAPNIASQVVEFATTMTFGKPQKHSATYRTIIECMANTKNHATHAQSGQHADGMDDEVWWLAVSHDPDTRITRFAFVDMGVGVFRTLRLKLRKVILRKVGIFDELTLANDLFQGRIESRTGLRYRGKGFPSIYNCFKNGQIHRLVLISNEVYMDLDREIQRRLPLGFRGTFLAWEIRPELQPSEEMRRVHELTGTHD